MQSTFALILALFLLSVCVEGFHWRAVAMQRRKVVSLQAAQKYQVTIEHEGKDHVFQVSSNYNILDAALDNGLELSHDCKLGVCLTCPAKVISGKVDQSEGTLDESVVQQGYALMCIAKPQSDVKIKTISEEELVSAQFKREEQ
eukprot:gene4636-4968_t